MFPKKSSTTQVPRLHLSFAEGVAIRGVTPFWRASKTTNQPIQAGKPPRCRDPISTNQPGAARPCRDVVSTNQPDMLDPPGWFQKIRFNQPVFNQPFFSPRSLSFPVHEGSTFHVSSLTSLARLFGPPLLLGLIEKCIFW